MLSPGIKRQWQVWRDRWAANQAAKTAELAKTVPEFSDFKYERLQNEERMLLRELVNQLSCQPATNLRSWDRYDRAMLTELVACAQSAFHVNQPAQRSA